MLLFMSLEIRKETGRRIGMSIRCFVNRSSSKVLDKGYFDSCLPYFKYYDVEREKNMWAPFHFSNIFKVDTPGMRYLLLSVRT